MTSRLTGGRRPLPVPADPDAAGQGLPETQNQAMGPRAAVQLAGVARRELIQGGAKRWKPEAMYFGTFDG